MAAETRKSRIPKRNAKGQCPVKVGGRDDFKVFKFSKAISDQQVEERAHRLKEIYNACGGWNALSNEIAAQVRQGAVPVPLPDKTLSEHLGVEYDGWVKWRSTLVAAMPSIPFATLGEATVNRHIVAALRHIALDSLNEAASTIADIDCTPERVVRPVPGTLHEAFTGYLTYVEKSMPRTSTGIARSGNFFSVISIIHWQF